MHYQIRALTSNETIVELKLEASSEENARQDIKSRGWIISSIRPVTGFSLFRNARTSTLKSKFSLLLFSQELLALLNAGLSIVESLEALLEKENNEGTRSILSRLLIGLREGKRFSSVLFEQNGIFPPLFVGVIQASERTSSLQQSLMRFIDYQQRIDIVRNKIISAMIYPLILMIVGGGVSFFLIAYVVPRFAEVYRGTGRALPWLSQLLLNWGNFAANNSKTFGITVAAVGIGMGILLIRTWNNGGFIRLLSKLPGFGQYLRIYALSRLYLTLGMLLDGGTPIVTALITVEGMVSQDMKYALRSATASISSGIMFSDAFAASKLTTPISQRLLRVGERTGELGKMLTQSAHFYDGEISRWIDRFIRGFEPVLMAVIGIIVGAIVVLLYMPIFDLADGLS